MRKKYGLEFVVGVFMILGLLAFVVLSLKVSGLTNYSSRHSYNVTAEFENIGDLKIRAPVTIAGVVVGRVIDIHLDVQTYKAIVSMAIDDNTRNIPTDSTANIFTAGLLGANYISLTPGFDETFLKNGDVIENTNQALILQNLIGKFMFNLNKSSDGKKKQE